MPGPLNSTAPRLSRTKSIGAAVAASALIPACTSGSEARRSGPQDAFFARLQGLCGKAFEGRISSTDAADAAMRGQRLIMHVARCTAGEVRIPFHVGADRSRTWVVTRTRAGLRLEHDHRHEDGSPDPLTQYGGDTAGPGTAMRQSFPADAESIALFRTQNRPASVANVWAMEATPTRFTYELRRPPGPDARHFRVDFDLRRPVTPPPPAWGSEPRRAPQR